MRSYDVVMNKNGKYYVISLFKYGNKRVSGYFNTKEEAQKICDELENN